MRKIDGAKCRLCRQSLALGRLMEPADAQVWRCERCGERNYVPGGADCDCPEPGFGKGCSCRVARFPQLHYASDEWCSCGCHRQEK